MVIPTDRELEILAALRDDWQRLYRNELARLLWQEAERRGRPDIKVTPWTSAATCFPAA